MPSTWASGTEVRADGRLLGLLETPVYAVGHLATREGTVAAAIGKSPRTVDKQWAATRVWLRKYLAEHA